MPSGISKVNLEALMQNITGRALVTLKDGKSELKMNLIPPELGRMSMKFSLEDGQLIGKIVVSTPEAKMIFDQNLGDLQRALQQAGVNLTNLNVSLGSQGNGGNDNNSSKLADNGIDGITDIQNNSIEEISDSRINSLLESSINYIA